MEKLSAYSPGDQPTDAGVTKLNTNENPYPPPRAVLEAIRAVEAESLRRYPPPRSAPVRQAAARGHGLTQDQVIITNGGDELLRLAVTVFCEPSGSAAAPGDRPGRAAPGGGGALGAPGGLGLTEPTYSLYPVLASIAGTAVTRVPLREDFSLPADFGDRVLESGCRLAFVVNPHAPSGRVESPARLRTLAQQLSRRAVLLVDEAYVDFAQSDAIELVRGGVGLDNVLLLRSLSKGYSLAGLRIGYGLGAPGLIEALDKARDSYNVDILAQKAAIAALEHRGEASATWDRVLDERERVSEALCSRGFSVLPSQANFILVSVPEKPGSGRGVPAAARLFEALQAQGIYVRYFDQDRLRDKLRITIGTPRENDVLLAAMEKV